MSEILICGACKTEVAICGNGEGFYTGCYNPRCKIFIETGLYKTEAEVRAIWPWKRK